MAITTDSLITVESGGVTYDTIGLSKTLNNYTAAEIWDYIFCSASSNNLYHIGYGSGGMNYYTYQGNDNYVPFELRYVATNHNNFYYHPEQVMNNPDGLYMRVIWLQRTSNGYDNYITSSSSSNYKLITMFNAPHYVYECNTPRLVDNDHGSTSWNAGGYLYYSDGGSLYYYDDVTAETPTRILINRVVPAIIFKDKNDKVYIIPYKQNIGVLTSVQNTQSGGWHPSTAYNFYDYTGTNCIAFPVVINAAYQYCNGSTGELTSPYSDGSRLPEGSGIYPRPMYATTTINHIIAFFSCGGSDLTLGFRVNNYFRDVENCKKFFSLAGLHFKADKIYKPIIEGGYVTGFTDQLSTTSDLDNWDGKTKHDIPPSPPSPTPTPGDDAEPETFGWGGNEVAGMVRYYLLSQSEMEELQAFMSDASWRMDYRNCIIGMYVVPNGGLFFDAPVPTTLKFRIGLNEAEGVIPQDQELDTGISCLRISGVVNNESAVIELPRINGNFLDFEPYSKYMVYVPFCGVIPLPDYVAGKEIKVSIYPDVPTCTCTAVVTSDGRKIATAKGAYGSQLPVTSDGDGLKAASVINSLGNIIMGAGEVALGIGTGVVPLAIAGGAQMLGSGLQADLQLGQAYGYSIGASGDTSFFGAGNRCEYYVTYSKWNNPDVDEGELQTNIYGHTYGFVCNKRGLLKEFEGFTVCDNPHVYGFSCTSDEKDEIERLLKEGIIIHMHEE